MIEKYQLQRLIDLPIEGVAERLGLSVYRHKARCPFHNDAHPSLTFHVGKNRYRCYVCGAHGRSIDLVMNRLGLSFVEACRWLAHAYGIQLSDEGPATYGGFNSAGSLATGRPAACKGATFQGKPVAYSGAAFPGKPTACSETAFQGEPAAWSGAALSGKPAACNGADFQGKPAAYSGAASQGKPTAYSGVAFPERSTAAEAGSATEEAPFDVARYQRFFERPNLTPAAQAFLFEERHIDPRVARFCRLHSFRDRQQTNWLQIPYFDLDGRLVGIQNRNLDYRKSADSGSDSFIGGSSLHGKTPANSDGPFDGGRFVSKKDSSDGGRFVSKNDPADGSQPRFRFPKGSKCGIYNLPVMRMLKPGEPLFITEGCSDCWAMLSAGHKAIAIPSATLLKEEDLLLLRNGPDAGHRQPLNLHMFPDADAPGERLFLSLRDHLPQIVRHQLPAGCKDFGDYWKLQQRSVR